MVNKKESLALVTERFETNLWLVKHPTKVVNVISTDISELAGFKEIIDDLNPLTAIWQHTGSHHTAGICIPKGKGYTYNRNLADLIANGIDTKQKFIDAWINSNGSDEQGYIPKVNSSFSGYNRHNQKSYIVSDFNIPPNKHSYLIQDKHSTTTHRTHLIPAQTTGIENHRGLLIDYDGWLNSVAMNKFEQEVLAYTRRQTLYWKTDVKLTNRGLELFYEIYNSEWVLIKKTHYIDNAWSYLWYM